MPHAFSEDLRWRVIWMKEMLGYQVDEVAASLRTQPRTIKYQALCLKSFQFRRSETKHHWKNDKKCGHPPTRRIFIMEAVLKHPEKTLQT